MKFHGTFFCCVCLVVFAVTDTGFAGPKRASRRGRATLRKAKKPAGLACLGKRYRKWRLRRYKRWIRRGLRVSRKRGFTLLVDKVAHEMDLYIKGVKVHTYPVELGHNPRHRGRGHTPIGVFGLKYISKTRYYKGLLYKMPGEYMIHGKGTGQGRKGQDWTLGCVALSNRQVDDLYRRVGIEVKGMTISRRKRNRLLRRARLVIVPYGLRSNYCYPR